jgi:hypothetical protein
MIGAARFHWVERPEGVKDANEMLAGDTMNLGLV